ncbi:alcohol dehydrogenase [Hahella sp. CCB-MM4]|uniref:iron-containing alcohol dehydrogenase n=1 Tax=Hahella sp. (strain CCB-MM4) TaxID=1926491 RepID=UPI000B9C048B|nr:iron-containing alcohol dehydrogenase [Hahella sp. CCB-MM4]OZG70393.1 alcohol dehydrogenase [Hahella sp. CCB-MM4]
MTQRIILPKFLETGAGAIKKVPQLVRDIGCSQPLVVSDGVMASLGKVDALCKTILDDGMTCDRYLDTEPEPTEDSILPAVEMFSHGGFDCIVALGGGSVIDSAKAIALLARQGGRMQDFKVPHIVSEESYPVIACPTTAGTGSEVTRATIITDSKTSEKMLCMGPGLLPVASVVDYELTLTAPKRITADTGIDALTHAIEAYVSRKSGLFTDRLALLAMELIAPNLRQAVYNPENLDAKEKMMLGATLAGMAFSNASVALVHGMSRPIGAHFHVPHGMSNAMLLPHITAYSIPAETAKYADCARAMGLVGRERSDSDAVKLLLLELQELNHELSVPSLERFGISKAMYFDNLELMAEQAIASGSPANNPRVPSKEDIIELYKKVWYEEAIL